MKDGMFFSGVCYSDMFFSFLFPVVRVRILDGYFALRSTSTTRHLLLFPALVCHGILSNKDKTGWKGGREEEREREGAGGGDD
jgi:hypothetical protein